MPDQLSPRQKLALACWLQTSNLTLAGIAANVSRQCVSKWRLTPQWRREEQAATASVLPRTKIRPRRLFARALERLSFDLENGSEEIKTKSAQLIFSKLGASVLSDATDQRIAALSKQVDHLSALLDGKKPTPDPCVTDDFEFDEPDNLAGEAK